MLQKLILFFSSGVTSSNVRNCVRSSVNRTSCTAWSPLRGSGVKDKGYGAGIMLGPSSGFTMY